ncbi:MAG: hypothetical protein AB7P23_13870, partial [Amphiplicatus sp.]
MAQPADDANYVKTIDVRATPDQAFRALTQEMDRRWSVHADGTIDAVGATIKVAFPPKNGHWTFDATT